MATISATDIAEICASDTEYTNICAFLDMIAFSEGTTNHPITKNDGYDVIVCGYAEQAATIAEKYPNIITQPASNGIIALYIFSDYNAHPNVLIKLKADPADKLYSTAAGRYQLLYRYWVSYKEQLGLDCFDQLAQDKIALQQIKECRALEQIKAGNIFSAISLCSRIWASFPGAGYGQAEHKIEKLLDAYQKAGGILAAI